jgi:hypothetical protein
MSAGPRQILQQRFTELSAEIETLFDAARERTRREFAEQMNQSVRRLRIAPDAAELAATLADAAARFADGVLLFHIEDGTARNPRIEFPLSAAPAFASAVASADPLVALASAAEVSAPLAALLGHDAETRAHLFPVTVHDSVPALLYAWGGVQSAALELLTQAAAAIWAGLPVPVPEPVPSPFVTITPAAAPAHAKSAHARSAAWDDLPGAEQEVHLRAQRFARVHVAELRLLHGNDVQSGRARRNLYEVLRQPIEAARQTFRDRFFTCPSMVDYLDLELTRTLANDDPALLGHAYPGPLV